MLERPGTVVFHRPARVQPAPVERDVATISAPPTVPEPEGNTAWQVLAPVLGSAGMLGFAVVLGEPRYMIMAGVIAGVMLVSGVISRLVGIRSNRNRRAGAAERYRRHLGEVRARVEASAALQRSAAELANPPLSELPALVQQGSRTWERRSHHRDFLSVRLGTGTVPASLTPELELRSDPMAEPEPELLSEAVSLEREARQLTGVPIAIDLREAGCVAIVGDRVIGRRVAASLVAQFATLRSPADLAIAAHVAAEDRAEWDWLKWLPHTRSSQSSSDDGTTLISSSAPGLDVLLDQVASHRVDAVEHRRAPLTSSEALRFRQIVVVIDGYSPASEVGRLERLDATLTAAAKIGVLVVAIVDRPDDVPSDATATIGVDRSGGLTFSETRPDGIRIGIDPDPFDRTVCEVLARELAPLRSRSTTGPAGLDTAGLLELLGEQADTYDPQRCWAANTRPMTSPIGLGTGGEPFVLDIRESAAGGMGPHGILIGATGSGKSELLRTLVLGLAAGNPPEELSFVLADFKGGATFAGLEHLPHTAGTISNIESDPTLIDRMQEALYGEMERRQRVLRDAGFDRADEYRQQRRSNLGSGLDPLPALLVVVDEFGELLTARPDFAELFTSIGRTGRSLGVHLLLSSQRLDEGRLRRIESHLRYRICLRTFSPEESVSVIGSRASFDLPPVPGIGHISVDSTLTQFKAGLVSRPIRAAARTESQTEEIRRFDISGPTASLGTLTSPGVAHPPSYTTEMQLLIGRIEEIGRRARPVWLDPLPEAVEFIEIETAAPLEIAFGVTDVPRQQQQLPAVLDFSGGAGNLALVGGPRSGKSTALASLITAFAATASPEDVAFYGIDLGGGTLHHLETLPHVGSVFGRSHREEIPRLVRQLHALVERRGEEFRIHGLTSMADYRRARSSGLIQSPWGEVFLVVDNWGLVSQEFGIELSDLVGEIFSGGLHYGVHVILSAGRWQDIRVSLRDNIGGRFELRLTDPIESEIDRHASRQLPPDIPGRGIDAAGRLTQVMTPPPDLDPIRARWAAAQPVPPVRMLPALITEDDLIGQPEGCVGLAEYDLGGWAPDLFGGDPHFVVLGDGRSGKTTALRGMIRTLGRTASVRVGVVDYRSRLRSDLLHDQSLGCAATPEEAEKLTARILADLASRAVTNKWPKPEQPDIVLIVDDYDLVASSMSNPIGPLVDLLPRGSDLGFHLVVARRVAGVARASFEPVLQRLREVGTPTLVMDGDPAEGPVVGNIRATRQPPGRGLLVSRSRTTLVQVARFEPIAPVHVLAREESA